VKASEAWSPDELLTRASAGESAAFAALVRRYQRTVYSIALRMLNDRQRAEDLAQEVFLQLYRSIATIDSDAHLAFWLRKVSVNRAIDRIRQEARYDNEPLSEAAAIVDEGGETDPLLHRRMTEFVAQLTPAARAVVVLRYQEDLDPVDIASTLDMPINTVKSHLKRSLTFLRARVVGAAIVDDAEPSMSERSP
jgi:RNA polymerase sigma-70 factor (ECF subfamily)